jgi:hypothetical protein
LQRSALDHSAKLSWTHGRIIPFLREREREREREKESKRETTERDKQHNE